MDSGCLGSYCLFSNSVTGGGVSWIGPIEVVLLLATLAALLCLFLVRERRMRRRFQILADVASISDAGGGLEQTFDAICAILVPQLADFCMIDVIDKDRVPRRVVVRVAPGGDSNVEQGLYERMPSVPAGMLDEGAHGSLRPRFFERMSEEDLRGIAHDPEDLEFLRGIGIRSAITVALNARGRVTGALTMGVAWSGRRYRREDARFAWILSGRVALALDNCGLFADLERAEQERLQIADTLQRGLLPSQLPHIPGWSVAAMYRPAGAENEVGGDFYDVFRVPGGWMLAIGDVTGRGAHAASITAVARYTLRTATQLSDDLLGALEVLNRALLARGDSALCSLAAMTISEEPSEPVRLVVAGHPPPLLVNGERVTEAAAGGPVLGAFRDAGWAVELTPVEPGQQLVIVTDGVTEAEGSEGRFGEARLHAELRGATNPAMGLQRVEGSLSGFTDGGIADDVAILAIARASSESNLLMSMGDDSHMALVERLFAAFNRRDGEEIMEICSPEMEFFSAATTEAVGRDTPYTGPEGLYEYLADVAQVWEELQITPSELRRQDDTLLIRGRVYARSRDLGIRDLPVAWIWRMRDGLFVRGEVFPDPEQAASRFAFSGTGLISG